MSTVLFGVLTVAGITGLSLVASWYVQPRIYRRRTEEQNDLLGFAFAVVGLMYGILLAFVVFAAWDEYSAAQRTVADEESAIVTLYRQSDTFPPAVGHAMRIRLHRYTAAVVMDEWPRLARGQNSPVAVVELSRLYRTFNAVEPHGERETAVYEDSQSILTDLARARSERLAASGLSLPPIFFWVITFGAILTICFSMLFASERWPLHGVVVGMNAAMISSVLFLAFAINQPFSGLVRISQQPYVHALLVMKQLHPHD